MATITSVQSGVSPRAWHNVLPVGDGTAWACCGELPSVYQGNWGLYQTCQRFDLTTGLVTQSLLLPYGYGHSPAFLVNGNIFAVGGMGMVSSGGSQIFQAIDVVQRVTIADGSYDWQHDLALNNHGPGYDISGDLVNSTVAIISGGHGLDNSNTSVSWSRFDTAMVDFSTSPPTYTQLNPGMTQPRVYHGIHAIDAQHVIVLFGFGYAGPNSEARTLNTAEVLGTDGTSHLLATIPFGVRTGMSRFYPDTREVFHFGGTRIAAFGRPAATNDVIKINVDTGAVTLMPPMQLSRYLAFSARVVMGGKNYVCLGGGISLDRTPVSQIELYCTDDGTTSVVGTMPFNTTDHDRICVASGSKIVVLGGEDSGANTVATAANGNAPMAIIDFGTGAVCSRN